MLETDKRLEGYRRLIEISRDLASTLDLDNLLGRITHAAADITDAEAASILLYDDAARQLNFQVATNLDLQTMRGLVPPAALRTGVLLRRLSLDWCAPAPVPAVPIATIGSRRASVAGHHERHALNLSLRSEEGRVVGIAVHSWLERVAQDGLAAWPPERLDSLRPALRAAMQGEGVPLQRLEVCLGRDLAALHTTLRSTRGRWIHAAHREAACELALTGVVADTPVHAVIDRTFTDEQGVCWIIDYKTSCQGEGETIEDFLAMETDRYRGQLDDYRRLLMLRSPQQEVRTALYFPLLDAWCEVG